MPSAPMPGRTTCFSMKSIEVSMTFWRPLGTSLALRPARRNRIAGTTMAMIEIRAILLNANGVSSPKAAGHLTMSPIGGNSRPKMAEIR